MKLHEATTDQVFSIMKRASRRGARATASMLWRELGRRSRNPQPQEKENA